MPKLCEIFIYIYWLEAVFTLNCMWRDPWKLCSNFHCSTRFSNVHILTVLICKPTSICIILKWISFVCVCVSDQDDNPDVSVHDEFACLQKRLASHRNDVAASTTMDSPARPCVQKKRCRSSAWSILVWIQMNSTRFCLERFLLGFTSLPKQIFCYQSDICDELLF